jgi:hypothetical protein
MKQQSLAFLLLAVVIGCSLTRHKAPVKQTTVPPMIKPVPEAHTPTVEVKPIFTPYKAPKYNFVLYKGQGITLTNYYAAAELIKEHGNSEAFFQYVASKRTYYSHANKMKVTDVIKQVRSQLNEGKEIEVVFYTPLRRGKAIGGWDGARINQNSKFYMDAIDRAGHLFHETMHVYGWKHQGNKTYDNDNVNSVPYAMGYDFRDYLTEYAKAQLAVE